MIPFKENLRNRYEDVRAYAAGTSASTVLPEGLALILGRGVPDWMNTWSHILPASQARFPKVNAKAEAGSALPPDALRSQLTVMIARMAIKSAEEPALC